MKQPLIPLLPQPWSIWVYDVAGDSAREVWKSGTALDDSLPGLTEDGSFHFAAKNRDHFLLRTGRLESSLLRSRPPVARQRF